MQLSLSKGEISYILNKLKEIQREADDSGGEIWAADIYSDKIDKLIKEIELRNTSKE